MAYLLLCKSDNCNELVTKSYDHISAGYDQAWTSHMRDLTTSLIFKLNLKQGDKAIDLACGTGFATNLIAEKTGEKAIGVDRSEGMLKEAEKNYGQSCDFVNVDIVEYLKGTDSNSMDIITCCWGLGYSKPFVLLKQIKRILKPGGKVAIIDNSLFSLREIIYCSFLTFMEQPEKLVNLMWFRFLTGSFHLNILFRMLSMKPVYLTNGSRSYIVESGPSAIEKLRVTGAAAGFEYAANQQDQETIFKRFAQIIEEKYMSDDGINIIHRYLAGIAQK